MSEPSSIAVFGFGLIGASVALAARARWPALRVIAIDRAAVLASPRAREAANQWVDSEDTTQRLQAFAAADISVLAAPLAAMEAVLPEALTACRVVTDCGSTKRSMLAVAARHAHRERFVAGHPMAGKPSGGVELADAQLFAQRAWILCPEQASVDAAATVKRFVEGLGATVTQMAADQHDRAMALTSHLPQLLASALLVLADRNAVPQAACGPGFESATRVAGGPTNIWHDIFARNADHITTSLD
ncbi:MAG TPA: prephenate dehydrogenase/arogenate dehydrogenase family protein, partial [Polyangiaceae bacterium]|nr:prephenate dehydrogenase/arogenate dehydrogenase family protein [Polyangiaceae bacterium]